MALVRIIQNAVTASVGACIVAPWLLLIPPAGPERALALGLRRHRLAQRLWQEPAVVTHRSRDLQKLQQLLLQSPVVVTGPPVSPLRLRAALHCTGHTATLLFSVHPRYPHGQHASHPRECVPCTCGLQGVGEMLSSMRTATAWDFVSSASCSRCIRLMLRCVCAVTTSS